mmetsp:Transcript_125849/g.364127  ORF Transcript_125849/g.364127 Transcript_125849/m.364127 type:complete len:308 (+) Transcript_125849:99-1022(+)
MLGLRRPNFALDQGHHGAKRDPHGEAEDAGLEPEEPCLADEEVPRKLGVRDPIDDHRRVCGVDAVLSACHVDRLHVVVHVVADQLREETGTVWYHQAGMRLGVVCGPAVEAPTSATSPANSPELHTVGHVEQLPAHTANDRRDAVRVNPRAVCAKESRVGAGNVGEGQRRRVGMGRREFVGQHVGVLSPLVESKEVPHVDGVVVHARKVAAETGDEEYHEGKPTSGRSMRATVDHSSNRHHATQEQSEDHQGAQVMRAEGGQQARGQEDDPRTESGWGDQQDDVLQARSELLRWGRRLFGLRPGWRF